MNLQRRSLMIALAFAPLAARAQAKPQYTELKPPQPTESPGKIEGI